MGDAAGVLGVSFWEAPGASCSGVEFKKLIRTAASRFWPSPFLDNL